MTPAAPAISGSTGTSAMPARGRRTGRETAASRGAKPPCLRHGAFHSGRGPERSGAGVGGPGFRRNKRFPPCSASARRHDGAGSFSSGSFSPRANKGSWFPAFAICLAITVSLAGAAAGATAQGDETTGAPWGTIWESTTARPTRLIPIPLIRQGRDNTCGVACVQALLRYAGYAFDVREGILDRLLDVPESGASMKAMVAFMNHVRRPSESGKDGGGVLFATLRENLTLADLIQAVDSGTPVICLIQAWRTNEAGDYEIDHKYSGKWDSGHYVVAVGYDGERVYFMDPSTAGNYTYIPRNELDARWHGLGDITPDGVEFFEHAGIVVRIDNPQYSPGEFYKIL